MSHQPESREIVLVVNPGARKGHGQEDLDHALNHLVARGLEPTVVTGRGPDDAVELSRHHAARDVRAVVACGGDGMVNIVMQGVAGTGTPFGILPMGTGNDYSNALGLPMDIVDAAEVIAAGRTRGVDAGRAVGADGARWWASIACAGFDSLTSERANSLRWPKGPLRYDVAVLVEVARLRTFRFRMVADGFAHDFDASFVAIGNTHTYGGGFRVCPDATPFDGLMDVTVVGPVSRNALVRLVPKVKADPWMEHPLVARFRARDISLELLGHHGGEPDHLVAYADGDPLGPLPMHFTLVPGAIRLLVP